MLALTGREVYLTGQVDADTGLNVVDITVEAWGGTCAILDTFCILMFG